jgi:hypothetical protein
MGGEAGEGGAGGLHDGRVEGIKEACRAGREAAEVGLGSRSAPGAEGGGACLRVGVEVERGAVGPPVARQHGFAVERDMGVERGACGGEEVVEDVAHRHDGGARVHGSGRAVDRAHLAPGGALRLHDGHVEPRRSEADGRGEPSHASADHDDFVHDPVHRLNS